MLECISSLQNRYNSDSSTYKKQSSSTLFILLSGERKGSFTLTVNGTVFVSGTFDLFNVVCKLHDKLHLTHSQTEQETVTLTARVNKL